MSREDFEDRYPETAAPDRRWFHRWVRKFLCRLGWHQWSWKLAPGEPLRLSAEPPGRAICAHCGKSYCDHEWYCDHEMHSLLSPLIEINPMPLHCGLCGTKATCHWKPCNGGRTDLRILPNNQVEPRL